jgi:hypothetical protein
MSKHGGWIGVDLDGTLARYDGWKGIEHVGEPIPAMLERVKAWLAEGREVRICTARVCSKRPASERAYARLYIEGWCFAHLRQVLEVTSEKDFDMVELWDDRAVRVAFNSGERLA